MIRNNNIFYQTEEIQKKINPLQTEIEQNNEVLKEQKLIIQKHSDKLKDTFYIKWPKLRILKK